MLAESYCTESAVDFDAYRTISTHNPSSVMPVFFIAVFWFFLDFVEITTLSEIDDDQHVTETKRHVADALKNQKGLSMIYDMLHQHSGAPISSTVLRNLRLMVSVRSISVGREKEKAVPNDEIWVMIAGHMHAWAEIRATYDWYNRTEMNFRWI